jgi:hypothetical protein
LAILKEGEKNGVKAVCAKYDVSTQSYARLFNKVAREWSLGPPTRAEQRAVRTEIRNQEAKLRPEQVGRNAYRHPLTRQRAPRDMPRRRAPGWDAANFVLPRLTIEGLTLLTKSMADRKRAERSSEPYEFRRRYPKTRNYVVIRDLNDLFEERGLSQFCVGEAEPVPGRVRRFIVSE